MQVMALVTNALEATLVMPALYSSAIRPHTYKDKDGFSSVSADVIYQFNGWDKFISWHAWDELVLRNRQKQIHVLVLEQCVHAGIYPNEENRRWNKTTWVPLNKEFEGKIRICMGDDTFDWPLQSLTVEWLISLRNHHKFDFVVMIMGDWISEVHVLHVMNFLFREFTKYLPQSECGVNGNCQIHMSVSGKAHKHMAVGMQPDASPLKLKLNPQFLSKIRSVVKEISGHELSTCVAVVWRATWTPQVILYLYYYYYIILYFA